MLLYRAWELEVCWLNGTQDAAMLLQWSVCWFAIMVLPPETHTALLWDLGDFQVLYQKVLGCEFSMLTQRGSLTMTMILMMWQSAWAPYFPVVFYLFIYLCVNTCVPMPTNVHVHSPVEKPFRKMELLLKWPLVGKQRQNSARCRIITLTNCLSCITLISVQRPTSSVKLYQYGGDREKTGHKSRFWKGK